MGWRGATFRAASIESIEEQLAATGDGAARLLVSAASGITVPGWPPPCPWPQTVHPASLFSLCVVSLLNVCPAASVHSKHSLGAVTSCWHSCMTCKALERERPAPSF